MTTWESKLREFGVPENLIQQSAPNLREWGLNANEYQNLEQLKNDLVFLWNNNQEYRQRVMELEGFDPLQWLIDLLTWIGETLYGYIGPYIPDMGIILIGGLAMWFLPNKWKLIGAAPIIFGIWDVYNKLFPQT